MTARAQATLHKLATLANEHLDATNQFFPLGVPTPGDQSARWQWSAEDAWPQPPGPDFKLLDDVGGECREALANEADLGIRLPGEMP